MDIFALTAARESCRNYDPERRVEHEKLLKCVETARLSPSACNSQPWFFTVAESPETVAAVAQCTQDLGMNRFTNQAGAFIVITEQPANLSAKLGDRIKKQQYAQMDIGLATAHLCFAATEQGLSTCILGWFNEEKLKKLLSIDPERRIRLVVAVGYAAPAPLRAKQRKPLDQIAKFI